MRNDDLSVNQFTDAFDIEPLNPQRFAAVAIIADQYAVDGVFTEYLNERTPNSITAIENDFQTFAAFLREIQAIDRFVSWKVFMYHPRAWRPVTFGIVKAFQQWQLQQGFAVSSVNRRISTIRKFAELAAQSQAIDESQYRMIQTVKSISSKAARNLDQKRRTLGGQTRIARPGAPKANAVLISDEHAKALKTDHPSTPQGRKDCLLMCLLIDLGLRASEVAALTIGDVDMQNETVHVYRVKTDKHQTLEMTKDLRQALRLYLRYDRPTGALFADRPLFDAISTRSITARVKRLGVDYSYYIEIEKPDGRYSTGKTMKKVGTLSAHDLRHYLATYLSRQGLNAHSLMEAMGWASISTAQRYIEDSKIANAEAVKHIK